MIEYLKNTNKGLLTILKIIVKNYNSVQQILPFVVLIAMILTGINLSNKKEILAAFSLGYRPRYLFFSLFVNTIVLYLIHLFILLPINNYSNQEDENTVFFTTSGLWFKQYNANTFVNIKKIGKHAEEISDLKIWNFDKDFNHIDTKYIKHAYIQDNYWYTDDDELLDINLMPSNIIKSIIKPEAIYIFDIPELIVDLNQCGFDTYQYEMYFYKQLFLLVMLVIMMMLGFSQAMNIIEINRMNLLYSFIYGFIIFFLNDISISILVNNNIKIFNAFLISYTISLLFATYILIKSFYQ